MKCAWCKKESTTLHDAWMRWDWFYQPGTISVSGIDLGGTRFAGVCNPPQVCGKCSITKSKQKIANNMPSPKSKVKKMKPMFGWAIIRLDKLVNLSCEKSCKGLAIYTTKKEAKDNIDFVNIERIIRVRIEEV